MIDVCLVESEGRKPRLPAGWEGVDEVRRIVYEAKPEDEMHLRSKAGLEKLPGVFSFFADSTYEGGESSVQRPSGGVWITARGGHLQVMLKEPGQELVCRLEVPSWQSLLAAMEAALSGSSGVWERDMYAKGGRTKKKK
jgi:hypothetical protein